MGYPRRLLLILAGAALLAGCGDETKQVSPDRLVKASQTTAAAGATRFEVRGRMQVPLQSFGFSAQGVMDSRAQKGRMNVDLSELGEAAGQDPEQWKGEEVVDGFVMYMRIPGLGRALGASTPWLKLDAEEASRSQGCDIGPFSQLSQSEPTQMLQFLRAVSDKVEDVGQEEIRGVETTHYKATIDLRRYPNALPPGERDAARRSVECLIEQLGSSEIPTETWVDGDDLVRRMRTRFGLRVPSGAGGEIQTNLDITIDLTEFGVEGEDFSPPPADEVTDLLELQGASGQTF